MGSESRDLLDVSKLPEEEIRAFKQCAKQGYMSRGLPITVGFFGVLEFMKRRGLKRASHWGYHLFLAGFTGFLISRVTVIPGCMTQVADKFPDGFTAKRIQEMKNQQGRSKKSEQSTGMEDSQAQPQDAYETMQENDDPHHSSEGTTYARLRARHRQNQGNQAYQRPDHVPQDYEGYQRPDNVPQDYEGYQRPDNVPQDYQGYLQPDNEPQSGRGYRKSDQKTNDYGDSWDSST